MAARAIDPRCHSVGPLEVNVVEARRTLTVKQGIEQALAKKLVATLKDSKLKVEAQINGDKLRVSGKKRRRPAVRRSALLRKTDLELPLAVLENFRD